MGGLSDIRTGHGNPTFSEKVIKPVNAPFSSQKDFGSDDWIVTRHLLDSSI
jgi:hypothetical protein